MINTLRIRRAERRASQMRLAEQAGISHNRYWRIENGHAVPTEVERSALAAALGTTEAEIWPEPAGPPGAVRPGSAELSAGRVA
jgi:transcriptional regulator with XRE-family HTH domain